MLCIICLKIFHNLHKYILAYLTCSLTYVQYAHLHGLGNWEPFEALSKIRSKSVTQVDRNSLLDNIDDIIVASFYNKESIQLSRTAEK